jgi:hypothetical protein
MKTFLKPERKAEKAVKELGSHEAPKINTGGN